MSRVNFDTVACVFAYLGFKLSTANMFITDKISESYCFTVHFNSLNVTHQLMHFQYDNVQ